MDTKQIKLHPELEKAIIDLGFSEFTEIQEKVIPLIQQGHDVIGLSHTGSGKTAAFGFPSLEKVTKGQGIQLLILVPTRELCNQVAKEIFKFAKYKPLRIVETYGGVSIMPQIQMLHHADVVVSTPGRMLDHMERGTIDLSHVKVLVLDEADKMFEMGFIDDVKRIISKTPKDRQNLLFSATMGHGVGEIVHQYMRNPLRVKLQSYVDKSKLIQHYYDINARDKFSLLVHVLRENKEGLAIIFCATRRMVDVLDFNLRKLDIKAEALHGGLSQNKRKHVMDAFHAHKLDALIATDVAARGLDIKNVSYVINYDIPKTSEDYVHRIGRTARAGSEGKVVSLLAAQDHDNFRNVLQDRSILMHRMELPAFERIPFEMHSGRPQHRGGFRGGGGRGNSSRGGFGNRGSSSGFGNRGRHSGGFRGRG